MFLRKALRLFSLGNLLLIATGLLACSRSLFGQNPQAVAEANTIQADDPNAPSPTPLVPTGGAEATARLTLDELQAHKKLATEAPDLPEDVKTSLGEVYDRAIAQLRLADELAVEGWRPLHRVGGHYIRYECSLRLSSLLFLFRKAHSA